MCIPIGLYFRYDIFCKAAYAWLKENTTTGVSAENCKNVHSSGDDSVFLHFI